MKVVVLGGGIAGLCMGIYLHQHNFEVSVNERQLFSAVGGHAFLMHHDGIAVLKELAASSGYDLPGKQVDMFMLRNVDGEVLTAHILQEWQCFKRTDLLKCLTHLLPQEKQKHQRTFSNFVYKNDHIIAAEFSNGELEYGDIFVGADGANSVVRKQLFGEIKFQPGRVKEVVGIAHHPELASSLKGKFTKFQQRDKALSFGLIPTSDTEVVWFMQYDPSRADVDHGQPEQIKALCEELLKDFPPEVSSILSVNDFLTSYIWNTRDFDLLPTFHHQNVVLIGDAAHVALPFTSAGTTNAMMDAKVLTECLGNNADYTTAFKAYYTSRSAGVAEHIHLGRKLRDSFLDPDSAFSIPLITERVIT